MDPDAKVQQSTLGTALFFSTDTGSAAFIGKDGAYTLGESASIEEFLKTKGYTRVYGLASTPDFGGQPNTIDTTTLDNTKAETSVLGLQPAAEVTYEINMMTFDDVPEGVEHNLRAVKAMADDKVKAHWVLAKASGVIIEYDANTNISYTADAQQDIEKFAIYHDVKSDIAVSLPAEAVTGD
ncbi:MAG: hypothetical protein IKB64_00855 [Paludibacteraceae bacterium]|nr:hypothetical protein [Paludibacteraceae bacterium]